MTTLPIDTPLPTIVDEDMIASTITANYRPARPNGLSASLTLAWRALLKIKHVPWQLIDVTMFPILMTLMMTYIFGGALAGSVEQYVQHLIPGILVLTVAMISMYTAVGLNTDISKGIFDRFRSLPFWRPAVLVGALLGDMIRYTTAGTVVIILGLILGFRPEAGFSGIVLAMGLLLVFAFSLSWIWTTLGLLLNDPESVSIVAGMTTFPLTFISNVFVNPATMPELLQGLVNINPVTLTATAIRGLMNGNATPDQIAVVFLACGILIAIFAPLTMYLYNNKNSK